VPGGVGLTFSSKFAAIEPDPVASQSGLTQKCCGLVCGGKAFDRPSRALSPADSDPMPAAKQRHRHRPFIHGGL
jgi:hypothetical protein